MPETSDISKLDRQTLEEELEQLRAADAGLERKTKDMWSAEVAALVVASIALVVGLGALVAAITKSNGGTTTVMMRSAGSTGSTAKKSVATGMAGAAGSMMGAQSSPAATSPRTVNVTLGEMFVRPAKTTITAGKVTFVARNTGMLTHELMIERVPIKMESPGHPVEKAAMGMIDDMGHGGTGRMTLKLTPGTYELFCNVPGHYPAGQHTVFTVTKT